MGKKLDIINLSYQNFNNINLSFDNNTFYSIIGSNNCGKTTLFKLISGIIPTNNMFYYNDIPLNIDNRHDYIINFGIAYRVNVNSFVFKTVMDEMIYPLHNLGYSRKRSLDRIKEVLSIFDASDYLSKKINELAFHEKQLLLIMIALLHKPKIILLDSVLSVFSKDMKDRVVRVLKKLTNDNMTTINFTNSLEDVYDTDKIILMDHYKIIGEYNYHDIYTDDKLFYEHNIEIPFMIDLSIKLKMYNITSKEYSTLKEMIDDIWP